MHSTAPELTDFEDEDGPNDSGVCDHGIPKAKGSHKGEGCEACEDANPDEDDLG